MHKKIFTICLTLLIGIMQVQACPCEQGKTIADLSAGANQIFVGKVIGVNTNWISGGMKYTFVVEKTWKRGSDSLLVVNTGWDYECGSQFEEGKKYLVYGIKKFSLKTNECMGSKRLDQAVDDLEFLGEGNPPRASAMVPMAGWSMGVMILIALVFLAFVVLKKREER